ncbi:MAG: ATP-dependent RecD-like DNA helicase [Polyangiaceae bacterium]|nr:ATP-dependent RecD-like DNA helicase [Polyangiaceae bacterium]
MAQGYQKMQSRSVGPSQRVGRFALRSGRRLDHARRVRTLFDPPPGERKPPKPGELVSVEGEVVRVTYENDDTGFRVFRVTRDGNPTPEVWVGVTPPASPGTRVRATGKYEVDAKHGTQFRIETLLVVMPETTVGVEKYLGSGVIPGVGPAYAKRIVEVFGEKTLSILDQDPERIREVPGFGDKRADAVIKAWNNQRAVGAIMIFLQTHGASPALATRIHKRFGTRAIEIVSRDPYRLSLDVWGVGFKTADRLARSIGIGADAPERAQAGVLQTLHDATARGHVYAPRPALVELSARMLEQDDYRVDAAIDQLALSGHVVIENAGEDIAIYPKGLFEAESSVAARLRELLTEKGGETAESGRERLRAAVPPAVEAFETGSKVKLAAAQLKAVEEAAHRKVLVITGGPGVGKTTIVKAILAVFDRAKLSCKLAAPTGRAAKRMSEATKREATTLHRLLEFDPKERSFSRNRKRPLDTQVLIVDEASMLDIELANAVVQALPDHARLVFVGDVDQLPSVGPGAVLRDLIYSDVVPTVRLSQIFRQAEGSLIVENAHRIHEGKAPISSDQPGGQFHIIVRKDGESAADTIQKIVTKNIPDRFGLDPKRDVQVLVPMHRGETGTMALNQRLQAALNPTGPSVSRGGRVMRVGDKVMQLKNDAERDVYNGDVGFIQAIDLEAREVLVRFDDDREVSYDEGDLDELSLAYATSIHKSQGSEYPAVVIPLLTEHFVMLSRNLFYTAVTRGKKLVVLVANPRAIHLALAETRKEERKTFLSERLRMRR